MEREMDVGRLAIGSGGWVRYTSSASPAAAYVRYEDLGGRLEPVELYLERLDDQPIGTDLLRSIRLGELDAWVNANSESVRSLLALPGPDLRRAARWGFAGSGRARAPRPGKWREDERHWLNAMLAAQVPGSGERQGPLREVAAPEPHEPEAVNAALDVPPAKPYGDDFYKAVAAIYRRLALASRSPGQELADANGVMASTAHRWIKIARQKGFLEPGRKGKAG